MELGAHYSKEKTVFTVWSPLAKKVSCRLYLEGDGDNLLEIIEMKKDNEGFWSCQKTADLHGTYYTYYLEFENEEHEAVDIYAKALGVNGNRAMVVDLEKTNPEGFCFDIRPNQEKNTDAIIYELHIRDFSIDESSGIINRGKFLGLAEDGTRNKDGLSTGLNHIKELGVTHVQILPSYDYATVDETKLDISQYNWGYDPKNYNAPEGSYSTNPYNGETRIREMKQMIMTFHKNGIRVNMDVVYNHTYDIENSWFQKTVPNYYYRSINGEFTNGSGCGNETASEKEMMRRFMIDSVTYWAKEYHIDGFRFDLMALHDLETMQAIRDALDKIDTSIMIYGEGWSGGTSGLNEEKASLKTNINKLRDIGAFNDDIRDSIKGNVFLKEDKGFVSGKEGLDQEIRFAVCGATFHDEVKAFGKKAWANNPNQSINYISCHDNYTFWDKLCISNKEDSYEDKVRMNKLGAAILFTSQGVPFMQAGEEMLRTKPDENIEGEYVENSYRSSDYTNSIKWVNKSSVLDVFEYYKGLISLRKNNEAFRLGLAKEVQDKISFVDGLDSKVVAYTINHEKKYMVIYNAKKENISVDLPNGQWEILVNDRCAGNETVGLVKEKVEVSRISAMVLVQND